MLATPRSRSRDKHSTWHSPKFASEIAGSRARGTSFRRASRLLGRQQEATVSTRDHRGLSLSSGTPRSVDRYERALGLLQIYSGNPLGVIDEALAEEPDFIAGYALRAGLFVTSSERRAVPELQSSVEAGEALIARGRGNERERAQLAAARAWLDGDFERATDRYNRI